MKKRIYFWVVMNKETYGLIAEFTNRYDADSKALENPDYFVKTCWIED